MFCKRNMFWVLWFMYNCKYTMFICITCNVATCDYFIDQLDFKNS